MVQRQFSTKFAQGNHLRPDPACSFSLARPLHWVKLAASRGGGRELLCYVEEERIEQTSSLSPSTLLLAIK